MQQRLAAEETDITDIPLPKYDQAAVGLVRVDPTQAPGPVYLVSALAVVAVRVARVRHRDVTQSRTAMAEHLQQLYGIGKSGAGPLSVLYIGMHRVRPHCSEARIQY